MFSLGLLLTGGSGRGALGLGFPENIEASAMNVEGFGFRVSGFGLVSQIPKKAYSLQGAPQKAATPNPKP